MRRRAGFFGGLGFGNARAAADGQRIGATIEAQAIDRLGQRKTCIFQRVIDRSNRETARFVPIRFILIDPA